MLGKERKRGKKDVGMVGGRGKARIDGYDGKEGFGGDGEGYQGYDAHGRDGASYRGGRRHEMSEGLDRRRTILGEVSGRY